MTSKNKTTAEIQQIVDQALDEMYAAGEKPTIRSLIERVGRDVISSTSTASKYKRSYEERRRAKEQQIFNKIGFSQDFTDAFIKEINRFQKNIENQWEEAFNAIHSDNIELSEELKKMEVLLKEEREKVSQQTNDINALKQTIKEQKRDFEYAFSELDKNFNHRLSLAEKGFENEITNFKIRNEELSDKLKKCEFELESAKEALINAQVKMSKLENIEAQNDVLIEENNKLKGKLSELEKKFSSVSKDAEIYQLQMTTMKESHEKELRLKEREIEMLQKVIKKLEKK
ncbi:DNA-binding protein [Galenea microaerophila]